jgi:hypothetical protein
MNKKTTTQMWVVSPTLKCAWIADGSHGVQWDDDNPLTLLPVQEAAATPHPFSVYSNLNDCQVGCLS